MTQEYRVCWSNEAEEDLLNHAIGLVDFLGSPDHAKRVMGDYRQAGEQLSLFPHRGSMIDPEQPGRRSMGWNKRATFIFKVDDSTQTVEILRVLIAGRQRKLD